MKYIHMTFENGETWQFPAYLVARERAIYFAEQDTGWKPGEMRSAEYDRIYQEEFDYTIGDDDELHDWLHNNMHWSDVKDRAVLVPKDPMPYDYESEFTNAKSVSVIIEQERKS